MPPVGARVHVVRLPEALKQKRQRLGPEADSRVRHHNRHRIVLRAQCRVHDAAARRELDRVRQQIPEHLLHPIGVAPRA